jgi:NAD(P)-dependent dehydrogenase (short-subunit alcohol dehydrogenase family)
MSGSEGIRVIVTGPTSGIGQQIARALGAQGAELVLACRNLEQGNALAAEIGAGARCPDVLYIDTASQRAVRAFADTVRRRYPRIDVLVNNAGISMSERRLSPDGIELTFATNVLGYQLLTLELLDLMKASAPARIVNVASTFAGDLDLDDLQFERRPYDGLQAYAQSKACDRLLTWAVARRLHGTGVTANAMAPGFVQTGLSRNLSPELRSHYSTRVGRPVEQGADTAVWLAAHREVDGVTGRFFMDRRELPCEFRDEAREERLWESCAGLLRPRSADAAAIADVERHQPS